MALDEKFQNMAMVIIGNAGAARAAAFKALAEAKNGNFEKSKDLLEDSKKYARLAHIEHGELLGAYSRGEIQQSDMLIAHAQDHLMNAELAKELISEIIELRQIIERR